MLRLPPEEELPLPLPRCAPLPRPRARPSAAAPFPREDSEEKTKPGSAKKVTFETERNQGDCQAAIGKQARKKEKKMQGFRERIQARGWRVLYNFLRPKDPPLAQWLQHELPKA